MDKERSSVAKTLLRLFLILLALIVVVVGGYLAYVFISYRRLGDANLEPSNTAGVSAVERHKEYSAVSYNIGFGAYESDYGFFMDGGKQSRAWSKERLDANLKHIGATLAVEDADFYFVQEVDVDSTRSYRTDERDYLTSALGTRSSVFAQNHDSPYLFYPLNAPHGASESGIMTFAKFDFTSARRTELPVESGFMKIIDLDRCYLKCRVPVKGEDDTLSELVIYNFHLSAYTSDGTIATEQLEMLLTDMDHEYALGNYCVAGGDFNKDILGDSSKYFGKGDREYNWAQPIPAGVLEGHRETLIAPLDENAPVPSCRNADGAYHEGQLVLTIDGFLVTPNVSAADAAVIDTGFAYSDHNPVRMTFTLKE